MVLFSFGEAIQTLLDGTPAFCLKKTDDPELIVNKAHYPKSIYSFPRDMDSYITKVCAILLS